MDSIEREIDAELSDSTSEGAPPAATSGKRARGAGDDQMDEDDADAMRVVDEALRVVDVSKAGNRVWLAKLPAFLMRQWAEAPEHTDLGSIRIETNATSQQGKTTPIVTLHLRETAETAQFPKNYQLQFKNSPPGNMLVFTERTEDASLAQSIEGWVQHECNVQPVMDDSYRNMLRARRVEAERPKRTTQAIEVTGQSRLITLEKQSLQIGQTSEFKVMPKKRRNEDLRRDRLPREEVIELIFKAYESHDYYSLKGMVEKTDQPTAFVKELLGELCDYIPRGPFKSLYQLKSEYKATQDKAQQEERSAS